MSVDSPDRLEEERRLCYVGITRAERSLLITRAESRRIYGRENIAGPSRFLAELPAELLREVRVSANITRPVAKTGRFARASEPEQTGLNYRIGTRVLHAKFGEGVVLDIEGQGDHARVQVNFADHGRKILVAAYAKLQALGC